MWCDAKGFVELDGYHVVIMSLKNRKPHSSGKSETMIGKSALSFVMSIRPNCRRSGPQCALEDVRGCFRMWWCGLNFSFWSLVGLPRWFASVWLLPNTILETSLFPLPVDKQNPLCIPGIAPCAWMSVAQGFVKARLRNITARDWWDLQWVGHFCCNGRGPRREDRKAIPSQRI